MSHTHIMISHLVSFSLHPFLFPHHLCRNANLNHLKQPFRSKCGWYVSKLWMVKIRCASFHLLLFFKEKPKIQSSKYFLLVSFMGKYPLPLTRKKKQHRQKSSTVCIMDVALVGINRLRFSRSGFLFVNEWAFGIHFIKSGNVERTHTPVALEFRIRRKSRCKSQSS